ncbi:MAG: hypothetical protein U9R25_12395 [Chloroflexota bacterium]|nr:hypothetical protein [Chloroflexota bacterium]
MKRQLIWIIPIVILLLVVAGYYGIRLYRELTASVQVEVGQGPVAEESLNLTPPPVAEESWVALRLKAVGLNKKPVLGDTAISGHLQRLEAGEVSEETLLQYADDLEHLNQFTAEQGARIPTDFWDVQTEEMEANSWDEYSIVQQISIPEAEPYLLLLAQGYGRFLQFKAAEVSGEDTALDAALDMFAFVDEYHNKVMPPSASPDDPAEIKGRASAMLMVWQSLVAGSTRTNPITGEPMFSHSIFARDNVGTMHQYDVGQAMSIADVWGVTGFAAHFVGIPENNNQVEHMSISKVLQIVLNEPVAVLDGIEEEKLLLGHADQAEAEADMALNNAIHKEFVPLFVDDWQQAVERLRCVLKDEC